MKVSVVLPSYNEAAMLTTAAEEIGGVLQGAGIPYELLFVDDGSTDGSWEKLSAMSRKDPRIRGIRFSRNFGKEAAMFAGLEKAAGDCAVVMDTDLQHPPETLVEMVKLWKEGYEIIEGVKKERGKESGLHRLAANSFYRIISHETGTDMQNSSDFKLLDRKVIDALNAMPERKVFFRALSFWVGFKKTEVEYEVRERTAGESKWSTRQLVKYAISNIGSFSSRPLYFTLVLGVLMLGIAVVFGVISLAQKIAGQALGGFTTVILLLLLSASLIMISLGIIGYYLARIYEEIKGRPRYIITEECGNAVKR